MYSQSNKTILVTGGAGYIGSHTVLALVEENYNVVILDKAPLHSVFCNTIKQYGQQIQYEQVDLLQVNDVKAVFVKYKLDGVIHFAADPAIVSPLPEHASAYYTNNLVTSINLIDLCRQYGVDKFIFSSTAAMYGIPESLPISENSKVEPINIYGYTKSVVERMLQDYSTNFGFNSIALRYFNACGGDKAARTGECHWPEIHLIPCILQSIGTDKVFQLYGDDYNTPDGTNVRDYIHVSDLASGHVKALDYLFTNTNLDNNKTSTCEAINLANGTGYSNKQIFEATEKVVGRKIPLQIAGRRGKGDPDELVADNTKALELLKWKPVNSDLINILETAWNWEGVKKNLK
jgi:UDP-glucose 4-epimerase